MAHVFSPISHDEIYFKLLDVDFDYTAYHCTINELLSSSAPSCPPSCAARRCPSTRSPPDRSSSTRDGRYTLQRLRFHVEGIGDPDTHRFWVRLRAVILDGTVEPAPQLSVTRPFADKHRKLHPDYGDRNLVEDLYCVPRSSAALSPYVTPLYLVVLRELGTANNFTLSSLARRDSVRFSVTSPTFARLTSPATHAGVWWCCPSRWWCQGHRRLRLQLGQAQVRSPKGNVEEE
ncbi:hypothetical protein CYMTET_22673 [Cymbomonas tetramitiformis]|uniref:Uncharacterized protein n=1 Tax=Cymbomonas tetramitiformis TaxID=36881 RepID=A0AAE0FZG1_9CHLO|nr:hypothetical protein CYMTET_22673 [Cymbomonas tetramitiformis]